VDAQFLSWRGKKNLRDDLFLYWFKQVMHTVLTAYVRRILNHKQLWPLATMSWNKPFVTIVA
jgi:hypothetical protein